ncbi:MAG: Protein kinase [Labilithrix sp.]|nr:Protein kinase [Labilithrix sp.]
MSKIHHSVSDVAQTRVGTRIRGKWRVDKLLGVGGMGAVYAATHRNGSRVALKVLHPQLSMMSDIRARFAREGYVANAVNHPGVVRVLDDDETEDGAAFLVMELLEGETADARARRLGGRLSIDDALLVADALCDVLAAAHASGIVHRDIKPENVFFAKDGAVKVLDFGIARLRAITLGEEVDDEGGGPPPHLRTRTGVTIGTPAFMPPEQALGRTDEVDALSDVWAVGATLFALLAGRIVHDAKTHMEVVIAAATAQAKSLGSFAPDLPKAVVELVDRALAFKKEDRWPSARAMQVAVQKARPPVRRTSVGALASAHPSSAGTPPPYASTGLGLGSQAPASAASSGRWAEERKLATTVFAELVGFSDLANDLEPDAVRELANAFFEPLSREVEAEGGTVIKYVGDGIMAAFGVPTAHEDDAARAVRAALVMTARVRELAQKRNVDVALRAGINTGLVMVGTVGIGSRASADVMGATVNVASRIESAAQPGEVLVGVATERLVHDRFVLEAVAPVAVKGVADPVAIFRVVREREDDSSGSVRLRSASGTPFFARQRELELLVGLFDTVRSTGSLRIAEITGEVGLGKGHLLRQLRIALAAREPQPTVLHATRVVGVAPLGFVGKMLRARFNVRVDDSPEAVRARVVEAVAKSWEAGELEDGREAGRLLADLVAPTPVAPLLETEISTDATRTVSAFSDWVRRLARATGEGGAPRPVVMIIEQVQWSDQASLDLLQYLVRALRRERVLVVISARPETSEHVPSWMTGSDIRTKLELHPFPEDVMDRFLDDLFRQVPSFPREVKREIMRRAEGNPDLCKELVRLLVDRGALAVDEQHVPVKWDKNRSAKLDLPDTVRGVLQARLDGLLPVHKEILKLASVIGRTFWVGALRDLLPADLADDELAASLDSLRARELIKPSGASTVSGERELTFATQALCDAAYELVPRAQSVAAHRKVADWLLGRGELWEGGHANLAAHLEAAGEKPRARRLYLNAARHAVSVCAYPEAVDFFGRVAALWDAAVTADERITRAGVLRERAAAESRTGRFEEALRSLDACAADLEAAGVRSDDAVHAWVLLERGSVLKEYGRVEESIAVLSRAVDMCRAQLAPSVLHMRVFAARAFQYSTRGEREAARRDVEEGLRVGQQLHIRDAAWHVAMARLKDAEGSIYFFSGDLVAAEGAYQAALELRELAGDTQGLPDGYVNLGGVAYTRGDHAAAAAYYERALAAAKKARWAAREAIGHSNLGQVKLALGQHEIAASELAIACRLGEEGGYLDVLADSARALVEVELARGDVDLALTLAATALAHAERSQTPSFVAMAHAASMDAWLAKLYRDRDRAALANARDHQERACVILRQIGQDHLAETIARRYGQGSNATVDT